MRKTQFTKFLSSLSEEELREELDKLYVKYKPVKDYYTMELGADADRKKIFESAKKKISNLYARRRARSRVSKTKTILKEFEQISIFDHELASLYLHHASEAASHLNYYGYIKDPDLNSLVRSTKRSIDLLLLSGTLEENRNTLFKIREYLGDYFWMGNEVLDYFDEMLK